MAAINDHACVILYLRSRRWIPISLSSVLEPVGDLCERETSLSRQAFLLVRGGISVLSVAILESNAGLLFKAVNSLLSIPYSAR